MTARVGGAGGTGPDGTHPVRIPAGACLLDADLTVPRQASGVVVFAHGSGSGRLSPRNRYVARVLVEAGLATVLADLLTPDEEAADLHTGHFRFDIPLLSARVASAFEWAGSAAPVSGLPLGLFGASTGAAAALTAAVAQPERVRAVVSRGGRPDLAAADLGQVRCPTLLLVGGQDGAVLRLNRQAQRLLTGAETELSVVPGAGHLFEEPGTLEQVARLAAAWFLRHLPRGT